MDESVIDLQLSQIARGVGEGGEDEVMEQEFPIRIAVSLGELFISLFVCLS